MAKMVYGQSVGGITLAPGRYVAKFTGTEDRDPIQDSKFGNEGAPRMAWMFEVLEGEKRGEKVGQETGTRATAKSACARVIAGLAGGMVQVGQAIDTDQFIGKNYVIKIGPNPNSEKGNLYIADIDPHQNGSAPANRSTALPNGNYAGPAGSSPPPRKPAAPGDKRYWFAPSDAAEPTLMGFSNIQKAIIDGSLNPDTVECCPEGESEYRPAAAFGFKDAIVF